MNLFYGEKIAFLPVLEFFSNYHISSSSSTRAIRKRISLDISANSNTICCINNTRPDSAKYTGDLDGNLSVLLFVLGIDLRGQNTGSNWLDDKKGKAMTKLMKSKMSNPFLTGYFLKKILLLQVLLERITTSLLRNEKIDKNMGSNLSRSVFSTLRREINASNSSMNDNMLLIPR
ncbi:4376_t:CDS:2 [Ambispora gerdemannii]|uniref:4376_t:CDS:1 n=1 Tax=Ambispora gerdemannii TaxID=144530 RepID=A0A9N9BDQ9_9GLOM|nr:4376_t:CDS:2 [Ambispora gerdemannii]